MYNIRKHALVQKSSETNLKKKIFRLFTQIKNQPTSVDFKNLWKYSV